MVFIIFPSHISYHNSVTHHRIWIEVLKFPSENGCLYGIVLSFFTLWHTWTNTMAVSLFYQTTFSPAASPLLLSMCCCDYILSNCFRPKSSIEINIANLVVLHLFHWIWSWFVNGGQTTPLGQQNTCGTHLWMWCTAFNNNLLTYDLRLPQWRGVILR